MDRRARRVEVDGQVCLDAGWLEQVACTLGTREHEALVSVTARPRDVHAGLLLLGLEAGRPGSWRVEDGELIELPPSGAALGVRVRWTQPDGQEREEPVSAWIRDVRTGASPALDRWVFAGSLLHTLRDGSVRYEADASGSVIGLVTFGDEVLALPTVKPDSEAVWAPEWEAWSERLPPIGTPVTLLLEPPPER